MEEIKEMKQFDSLLGGQETLPNEVHVLKFAAARCKEISVMTECIINPCSSKLVFQTLPVHMRRRIMSHNSKRLPRKLRAAYEAQLAKSGQPLKLKKPSRKYRRRPKNLLQEFERRKRIYVWLETHIWHAKRFHMTEKWGYKLPLAPCDRAFRACYRASSKHCLLQDISYFPSFQISGSISDLEAGFKKITSTACGLSVTSKAFLSGNRAGHTYIFHINQYPKDCIGKISYIWLPQKSNSRTVWIFTHPSFYREFFDVLLECFNLITPNLEKDYSVPKKKLKLREESTENIEQRVYKNENITLTKMKDKINCFRLTGPLSHAVLSKVLTPLELHINGNKHNFNWFSNVCNNKEERSTHETQTGFWKKIQVLKSPTELPAHLVMGLNVQDPRINYPQKRTKSVLLNVSEINIADLVVTPHNLCHSLLWNDSIRENISSNVISTFELNKLRQNESLVPGEYCSSFDKVPGVPVILIQRPGSQNSSHKRIGYDSGWDVITPSGYGMAFWMSFILRGGRAGGLREASKIGYESGRLEFQPDTKASKIEEIEKCEQLSDKYFRLPPNKRVNFTKLSINSPFLCRWQTLCNDWAPTDNNNDFIVCREKSTLKFLQDLLIKRINNPEFDWTKKILIPVQLLSKKKGKLADFDLICLPNSSDSLKSNSCDMLEPLKKDKNQKMRIELRQKHKLELKKLRRRQVKSKRKLLEKSGGTANVPKQNNLMLNAKYMSEMRELWLPTQVETVRHQCSRQTIGYVTHGDFSFIEARGCGVGYVTLQSIKKLSEADTARECLVLTRNTQSHQYRFATLSIIIES